MSIAACSLALIVAAVTSTAQAQVDWRYLESAPPNVTNIAACNDGVLHRLSVQADGWGAIEYSWPVSDGAPRAWRGLYSVESDGQISCASSANTVYANTIVYQGEGRPIPPVCTEISPGVTQCAGPIQVRPSAQLWDYWYWPDNTDAHRSARVSLSTSHQIHLVTRETMISFAAREAVVREVMTGARTASGNLFAARIVGATTRQGRRVVVAINDDNTFWMNEEAAPGALDLNPGSQWRMVANDFGSRLLGAYTTDLELAVVNGRLTAFVLLNINGQRSIYRGVFP